MQLRMLSVDVCMNATGEVPSKRVSDSLELGFLAAVSGLLGQLFIVD